MEMRNDTYGLDIPSTEPRVQPNVVSIVTDAVNAGRSARVRSVLLDLDNPFVESAHQSTLVKSIAQRIHRVRGALRWIAISVRMQRGNTDRADTGSNTRT
jgi:hypothetical protein